MKLRATILAALGVSNHLSAEQRHDIINAAAHTVPGGVAAASATALGWPLSDVLNVLMILFVVIQIAYVVWKWRRQARIDKERRSNGELPCDTEMGNP